jgi:hypothetical protein
MAWRLTIRKKTQCARRRWKHKMKVIPLHFTTKCQKIIVLHFRKVTMVLGTTTSKKKNWKQHYARCQWNSENKSSANMGRRRMIPRSTCFDSYRMYYVHIVIPKKA